MRLFKKNKKITLLIIGFFLIESVYAQLDGKRGVSQCPNGDCNYQDYPVGIKRESFNKLKKEKEYEPIPTLVLKKKVGKKNKLRHQSQMKKKLFNEKESNLPSYYAELDRSDYNPSGVEDYNAKKGAIKLSGLRVGDILKAVVEQALFVSPNEPAPIRAILIAGPFRGGVVSGEAILGKDSKKALLEFSKLTLPKEDLTYTIKAVGLDNSGKMGIEGEYESHSGRFFLGALLSSAASGYASASMETTPTLLGQQQVPSPSNALKQGASTSMAEWTKEFHEKGKSAPEYTETNPYQEIQIFIKEEALQAL